LSKARITNPGDVLAMLVDVNFDATAEASSAVL
jgi:hypothetical protein